ncbi:MAG TPA: PAS domain S-box protein [Syntrophales bacterium]|nr:PAS domain S-box protein [Syntrophales bacterium]
MYAITILTLQILDAIRRIEGWIESAVVDNEESPFLTSVGLGLALLFGLWRRYVVPLFRIDEEPAAGDGRACRNQEWQDARKDLECRFDLQGRLLDVPPSAAALTGFNRETMIGSLLSRFLREKDVATVVEGFIQVLRGEDAHELRVRLRTAGGEWMPVQVDLSPVIRSGIISEVRGVLRPLAGRPIPDRHADTSPTACIYVFRKGRMLFVNSRFVQSSGYDRREIAGIDPMQIIHPADRLRVRRNNIGHLKGNPSSSCDFRIVTRDGHVKWVRARVRSVMYKGEKAVLGNLVVMPAKEDLPVRSRRDRNAAPASA